MNSFYEIPDQPQLEQTLDRLLRDALSRASRYAAAAFAEPRTILTCVELVYEALPLPIRLVVSREVLYAAAVRMVGSYRPEQNGNEGHAQWMVLDEPDR